MIVKCPNCQIQYDNDTCDKCPNCEFDNSVNKTDNNISTQKINLSRNTHDYESIAKGLKIFAVIIFILTVIAAIIVAETIAKVKVEGFYSSYTKTNSTPIIVTLVSGFISGIFTLILSWIFDGISDIINNQGRILKK